MKKLLLVCLLSTFFVLAHSESRIVVLGSSTAAGMGPVNSDNAWVNRYRTYLKSLDASNKVINLAVGGYTTYHLLPTESTPTQGRPAPDVAHNITKALSYNPDAIIISLPSNDVANGYPIEEQLNNYTVIIEKATEANVPVWISTTSPRNFPEESKRDLQKQIKDLTIAAYGEQSLDLWTPFASSTNMILSEYDSGDGIHFNDQAHEVIFDIVVAADIINKIPSHGGGGLNDKVLEYSVSIDFGVKPTPAPWNNMTSYNGGVLIDVMDSRNNNTGISLEIVDDFGGENQSGPTVTSTDMDLPANVSIDCFWGNTKAFNGQTNPTAEILISGLNVTQEYNFMVFSSRSAVSDNREGAIEFVGTESETFYLDGSSNTTNTITASGMKPDENGIVRLKMTAGPNNNSANGFFYLNALKILPTVGNKENEVPIVLEYPVLLDLGPKSSDAPWNNLTSHLLGSSVLDLQDTNGNSTRIKVEINDEFNGFNESGPTVTNTPLNLPVNAGQDCFFGNAIGVWDGKSEVTGGLLFSNLYPDVPYEFSMFASRAGSTDNRETSFTVKGKNEITVYLDASSNTENIATASGIIPDDNGTISLTVGAGPNNNNGSGFYYINALALSPVIEIIEPIVLENPVGIDFGSLLSPAPWNNITSALLGTLIEDLTDMNGNSTKIKVEINDSFNGINESGPFTTTTPLNLPDNVGQDCLWGNAGGEWDGRIEVTGGLLFSNLYPDVAYDFSMFGSRRDVTDNRETYYTVQGKNELTVYLNTSGNTANIATASGIIPNDDGTISIEVGAGPNNNQAQKFFYLNALVLFPHETVDIAKVSEENAVSIYPNPVKDILFLDLKTAAKKIQVIDLVGKTVSEYAHSTRGKNQIDLTPLNKGVYMLRIIGENNHIITQKFIKQ